MGQTSIQTLTGAVFNWKSASTDADGTENYCRLQALVFFPDAQQHIRVIRNKAVHTKLQ